MSARIVVDAMTLIHLRKLVARFDSDRRLISGALFFLFGFFVLFT